MLHPHPGALVLHPWLLRLPQSPQEGTEEVSFRRSRRRAREIDRVRHITQLIDPIPNVSYPTEILPGTIAQRTWNYHRPPTEEEQLATGEIETWKVSGLPGSPLATTAASGRQQISGTGEPGEDLGLYEVYRVTRMRGVEAIRTIPPAAQVINPMPKRMQEEISELIIDFCKVASVSGAVNASLAGVASTIPVPVVEEKVVGLLVLRKANLGNADGQGKEKEKMAEVERKVGTEVKEMKGNDGAMEGSEGMTPFGSAGSKVAEKNWDARCSAPITMPERAIFLLFYFLGVIMDHFIKMRALYRLSNTATSQNRSLNMAPEITKPAEISEGAANASASKKQDSIPDITAVSSQDEIGPTFDALLAMIDLSYVPEEPSIPPPPICASMLALRFNLLIQMFNWEECRYPHAVFYQRHVEARCGFEAQ
ncbi:hypothetical protein BDZ91DRAFT_765461 [Kalaharituber pfeilii]|nr:hypothetical protein BDZ91DRAFT_765461 [Kalaharituber pfeilii]